MITSSNTPGRKSNRHHMFAELEQFEAPDQSFAGHRDILTRSLARYHAVKPYICGDILDVGCGRGYGFDVLQSLDGTRTGLDISLQFLREAQRKYASVSLVQATGELLPFRSRSFDTIIAFEVIEHLDDDVAFLNELKRLIRPGGVIALSTPNRIVSSGGNKQPLNPFHVREYTAEEFRSLLRASFSDVILTGQHEIRKVGSSRNRLVDSIPIQWKYLLPSHIQGVISVLIRPPLQISDCQFTGEDLQSSHTFLAVCKA
ncbi:MAG: class I SAM-dependent methyltransferase [Chloroflexaceae bacterium]